MKTDKKAEEAQEFSDGCRGGFGELFGKERTGDGEAFKQFDGFGREIEDRVSRLRLCVGDEMVERIGFGDHEISGDTSFGEIEANSLRVRSGIGWGGAIEIRAESGGAKQACLVGGEEEGRGRGLRTAGIEF